MSMPEARCSLGLATRAVNPVSGLTRKAAGLAVGRRGLGALLSRYGAFRCKAQYIGGCSGHGLFLMEGDLALDHFAMSRFITLSDCLALDQADPLRALREQFALSDKLIYLDGNSLGALPHAAKHRMQRALSEEWGNGLIGSWNGAGWANLPRSVGDKIARLLGAAAGEVVVADNTSVNLYKVLSIAMQIAKADQPQRRVVLTERGSFPSDLYILASLCQQHGFTLRQTLAGDILAELQDDVAVVALTHVNYRTGEMFDMAALGKAAHAAGALLVWDLAHSAGAVPVDLHAAGADFAVGCGYKYLNGGPGAPAFVWVHPRHTDRFWQPLAGWWGHASPFAFSPDYQPASGIARFQSGTPPVLSLIALDCGLDSVLVAEPLGGMAALRTKSLALSSLFIDLFDQRLVEHGFDLATPRDSSRRGSHVSLTRAEGGYAIVQALIERGVVGDFRAAGQKGEDEILRFGFAPLYLEFTDIWHAVDQLCEVMQSGQWKASRFAQRQLVT